MNPRPFLVPTTWPTLFMPSTIDSKKRKYDPSARLAKPSGTDLPSIVNRPPMQTPAPAS